MTICRIKNNQLFAEWPPDRLEPYQNPAYEGTGYPAAGYGQKRNKVVGLKYPKAVNPQLVGWENPQPVGQRVVPQGSINKKSDRFTRAQVATLGGLSGPCALGNCGKQHKLEHVTSGLGQLPPDPKSLRETQANAVIREAGSAITGMERQVRNPPVFTDSSVLAAWQTAVNSAKRGLERAQATKNEAIKTDAQFKKWLDAARAIVDLGKEVNSQAPSQGLLNALKFTAYETASTVSAGVQEGGKRVMTTLDFLTQPLVLGGLAVGALAIYAFAKGGGGSVVIVQQPNRSTP